MCIQQSAVVFRTHPKITEMYVSGKQRQRFLRNVGTYLPRKQYNLYLLVCLVGGGGGPQTLSNAHS
jgi:hypothetical protein